MSIKWWKRHDEANEERLLILKGNGQMPHIKKKDSR